MNTLKAFVLVLGLAVTIVVPGSAFAAAPANDAFAAAEELTGRVAFAEGTNVDASKETNEPNHAGDAGGASIWYRWTAPAAGEATVSTCESELNTLLAVYTGDQLPPPPLTQVAANDNCDQQSEVTFEATAGTTYRIAVDGFGGETGTVFLSLSLAPPNDDFANAQPLNGDSGSVTGTTVGSSSEDGEPDHGYGWNSAWFAWTAPSSGWASFETCGSPFDTVLAVYTGSELNALTPVADNDDTCGLASRVYFQASGGTVYRIAVAGYDGDTGDFTLSWNRNAPPPIAVGFPSIGGVARDGETLTANEGQWSGEPPFTYAYAWARCDRDFECDYIEGATSRTFTIRSVDVGYRLFVRVTASNAFGSTPAFSDVTSVVGARPPSNMLLPDVDGEGRLGAILVASPGSWIGTAPISYTYQWQACDATVTVCSNIEGQTGQVMSVRSVELGDLFRVVVTATNVAGSASAASVGTDVVRVTTPRRRCVVPNVRGKTLRAAQSAIKRGRCRVGRIRRSFSNRARAGRILAQSPRAGARRAVGARVSLVVSKGRRR